MKEDEILRGIRLSDAIYFKIAEYANIDHRSINKQVVYILEKYINDKEKRLK